MNIFLTSGPLPTVGPLSYPFFSSSDPSSVSARTPCLTFAAGGGILPSPSPLLPMCLWGFLGAPRRWRIFPFYLIFRYIWFGGNFSSWGGTLAAGGTFPLPFFLCQGMIPGCHPRPLAKVPDSFLSLKHSSNIPPLSEIEYFWLNVKLSFNKFLAQADQNEF